MVPHYQTDYLANEQVNACAGAEAAIREKTQTQWLVVDKFQRKYQAPEGARKSPKSARRGKGKTGRLISRAK